MPDIIVLGIGISPHKTDGALRFELFCKMYDIPYKILGEGKIWNGGDMNNSIGGGQKINELYDNIKNMTNELIIVTDTFDLFPIASKEEIISKYQNLCPNNQILISSEINCWPQKQLDKQYPITQNKYRFLNSGCIMGYRDDIYKLIDNAKINNNDDDQLFFTLKYLNNDPIILDHDCHLFQTLAGVTDDIIIHRNRIYNKYTNSYPVFIHGNGSSKLFLNHIENYIEPTINKKYEILNKYIHISNKKIFIALYIDSLSDFDNFLFHVNNLSYPNKIVYLYDKQNNNNIKQQIESLGHVYIPNITNYNFNDFLLTNCDYYFLLEQKCIVTKTNILEELIESTNKRIICPLLKSTSNKYFSNFWGALDNNGFYKRSDDYIDIVEYKKRGYWNVPYVSGCILFDKSIIEWDLIKYNKYTNDHPDMALCYNLRNYILFMYVTNNNKYGYLID